MKSQRVVGKLRQKTGIGPHETDDAELLRAFDGTVTMGVAEMAVAFSELGDELARVSPWLARLFCR